jgi:hypothetical protein
MLHKIPLQQAWLAACALAKALRLQGDVAPAREALRQALDLSTNPPDQATWLAAPGLPDYLRDLAQAYQVLDLESEGEGAVHARGLLRRAVLALMHAHPGEYSAQHAMEHLDG